jgi:hypothetical protein
MDIATRSLKVAREAAQRAVAASTPAERREALAAVAEALDPADIHATGFIRAVAAIAANAALASRVDGAPAALIQAAERLDACAGAIIEHAQQARDMSVAVGLGMESRAEAVLDRLDRAAEGSDLDGDGAIGWAGSECGLLQMTQEVRQAAASAGL